MKVKVGNTTICGTLYNVKKIKDEWHCVIKDDSGIAYAYKFNFEPIQVGKETIIDEPKIEVGSEWLWEEPNETLVVKCVGDTSVFYQWISDGSEDCEEIDDFLKSFKQKQKTVTMYFYDDGIGGIMAYSHKTHAPLLFTKEIEL